MRALGIPRPLWPLMCQSFENIGHSGVKCFASCLWLHFPDSEWGRTPLHELTGHSHAFCWEAQYLQALCLFLLIDLFPYYISRKIFYVCVFIKQTFFPSLSCLFTFLTMPFREQTSRILLRPCLSLFPVQGFCVCVCVLSKQISPTFPERFMLALCLGLKIIFVNGITYWRWHFKIHFKFQAVFAVIT